MLSARAYSASKVPEADISAPLSVEEAEQVLTALAGEYMRPWREWEASPHRMYSRVAPRPIPTIYASVEMSPGATGPRDSFLVGTIAVGTEAPLQPAPCVVDRLTAQVRVFADGQWLDEEEWLRKAPTPKSMKRL
jgi:hypothetical protein